jgi:hypothetical protein
VFGKKMQGIIFGPMKEVEAIGWGQLHMRGFIILILHKILLG